MRSDWFIDIQLLEMGRGWPSAIGHKSCALPIATLRGVLMYAHVNGIVADRTAFRAHREPVCAYVSCDGAFVLIADLPCGGESGGTPLRSHPSFAM